MKLRSKNIFVLIILPIIICSCSMNKNKNFDREKDFASVVNIGKDNNQSLKLMIFDNYGEVYQDAFSHVGLKVKAKEKILFAYNFNLRLFIFSEETNKWIEIPDKTIYTSRESRIEDQNDLVAAIGFLPSIPPELNAKELRIYVEGKIIENGKATEKTVSAFIDMPIKQ